MDDGTAYNLAINFAVPPGAFRILARGVSIVFRFHIQ
jgi:hypothetical protein